jgi:hypothetical protein
MKLLLVNLFITSLFDLLKKTWISPNRIISKKARKSFTITSFIYPYSLEILFIASSRDSWAAQGGCYKGFINSILGSANNDCAKRVFPCPLHMILRALLKRGCYRSSQAILVIKAWEMRLSLTSKGYKYDSLYKANA